MATATPSDTQTSVQITWHQRAAEALHSHATWAALATVVVLALKYLFNLQVTETEVLTFAGIMATYLFGASWVAAAHINAVANLGNRRSQTNGLAVLGEAVKDFGDRLTSAVAPQSYHPTPTPAPTAAPPADSSPAASQ